jgi:hypothetical protein
VGITMLHPVKRWQKPCYAKARAARAQIETDPFPSQKATSPRLNRLREYVKRILREPPDSEKSRSNWRLLSSLTIRNGRP